MSGKAWLLELRYETEGGATQKRMTSRPLTYTQAVELQAYWERRGAKARLVEINGRTKEQRVRNTLRKG